MMGVEIYRAGCVRGPSGDDYRYCKSVGRPSFMLALDAAMWKDTFGSLATITAILLSCAPFADDIPNIKRARSTGDRSPIVLIAIWANACLWIDYGIAVGAFHPISTTNLVGFVTGSYFLFTFYTYAPVAVKGSFTQSFASAASGVIAVYLYTFMFEAEPANLQFRLGLICCAVTIGLYGSPIGAVMRAVQLKTNRPISLFFATVGSLNAVLWSSFGLLSGDPWVYVPNMVGLVLSLIQLGAYHWYANAKLLTPHNTTAPWKSSLNGGNEESEIELLADA